jgi:hypothetical protein
MNHGSLAYIETGGAPAGALRQDLGRRDGSLNVNLLTELDRHPNSMPPLQLFLLLVFLCAYVSAVSGFLGERGRWRAAGIALSSAVGLCFVFTPWTLGALLVVGAIGAVGLFIVVTLLLSRALGVDTRTATVDEPAAALPPGNGATAPLHAQEPARAT